MTLPQSLPLVLISIRMAFAGPADDQVVSLASAMLGSFDNQAQAAADRDTGAGYVHDFAQMTVRPVQDPVVFLDGLYLYVENRLSGETHPYRQRIYRLTKAGRRIRLEIFRIDAQVVGLLALEPQMLSSLSPRDLTKEQGCDILFEARGADYIGSTGARSCKSAWKGSAYATSTVRIAKEEMVTLDRGYDENGVQVFGPTDGRGYEFRRSVP